ncbi:unnamed protein product [Closterium sp. NIES-64]|nr:unnamed protein product [Closterium sp. NIES-64]
MPRPDYFILSRAPLVYGSPTGRSVRVTNRPGQQLLGANGRDDGPSVPLSYSGGMPCGDNHVAMAAIDKRPFCIGVRIIRNDRLTSVSSCDGPFLLWTWGSYSSPFSLESVMAMIRPLDVGSHSNPPSLKWSALLQHIQATSPAPSPPHPPCQPAVSSDSSSSSDLIVMQDHVTLNLRCPSTALTTSSPSSQMSGSRIREAGRFRECAHMGGSAPCAMKLYALDSLIIDPFFHRVCEEVCSL